MLALGHLGTTVTAIIWALSVIAFVLAAMNWSRWGDSNLLAVGLALFVFVFAWNAVADA